MTKKSNLLHGLILLKLDLILKKFLKTRIGGIFDGASLLRKIYLHGPISVNALRTEYGGRKQNGYNLAHHRDASGGIIRTGLQQLESSGYLIKKNDGRMISDDGMKRTDRIATEVHKELQKKQPRVK